MIWSAKQLYFTKDELQEDENKIHYVRTLIKVSFM